jgi:hypothetical protein
VRPCQQIEHTLPLTASAADRRIWRAITSEHPTIARRLLQRERRSGIANIELMNFAPTTDLPALGRVEQLGRKTQHAGRNRPSLFLVSVEQLS